MEPIVTPLEVETAGNFYDIGERYTIGGRAYGPALAYFNLYADPETVLSPGDVIQIPEDWLGVAIEGPSASAPQGDAFPLLATLGIGALLILYA